MKHQNLSQQLKKPWKYIARERSLISLMALLGSLFETHVKFYSNLTAHRLASLALRSKELIQHYPVYRDFGVSYEMIVNQEQKVAAGILYGQFRDDVTPYAFFAKEDKFYIVSETNESENLFKVLFSQLNEDLPRSHLAILNFNLATGVDMAFDLPVCDLSYKTAYEEYKQYKKIIDDIAPLKFHLTQQLDAKERIEEEIQKTKEKIDNILQKAIHKRYQLIEDENENEEHEEAKSGLSEYEEKKIFIDDLGDHK